MQIDTRNAKSTRICRMGEFPFTSTLEYYAQAKVVSLVREVGPRRERLMRALRLCDNEWIAELPQFESLFTHALNVWQAEHPTEGSWSALSQSTISDGL